MNSRTLWSCRQRGSRRAGQGWRHTRPGKERTSHTSMVQKEFQSVAPGSYATVVAQGRAQSVSGSRDQQHASKASRAKPTQKSAGTTSGCLDGARRLPGVSPTNGARRSIPVPVRPPKDRRSFLLLRPSPTEMEAVKEEKSL